MLTNKKGFTLIELLIVIGIIAILAGIVIVALNPARQFAQANNTKRSAAVNAILNAIGQRTADGKGTFEGAFTAGGTTYTCPTLPTTATNIGTGTGLTDLTCLVPTYISSMPLDPSGGTAADTKYRVLKDSATGRITVDAPTAQIDEVITVTR